MKVMLSIKPEFVEKIFSGEKKYEFRKKIFKKEIESVIIYSTQPKGRIVGEFLIEKIVIDSPESIWFLTQKHAGVSYEFFRDYFGDRKIGYAIKIAKVIKYDEPINPTKYYKNFHAPQSFCYVK
jgi:predicted transcriptional regulator